MARIINEFLDIYPEARIHVFGNETYIIAY